MSEFEPGDVVWVDLSGHPMGLAIVVEAEEKSLRLHGGWPWTTCFYMHPGLCRKVGRVTPAMLAECLDSHARARPLQDERWRRDCEDADRKARERAKAANAD